MTTPTLTTAQAAAATGRTAPRIRAMCKAGKVPGAELVADHAAGRMVWRIPAAWADDPANRSAGPRGGYPAGRPRTPRPPGAGRGGWVKGKARGKRGNPRLTPA